MIPVVIPLVLIAAGGAAVVLGAAVLRSLGARYRVGRLIASTPRVSVADARALAAAGTRRYVRVDGRIDAEDEFEDADHRPLVFRRTRLQARTGRQWADFEDSREAVPFEVREGLAAIAVDADALADGLVVVPRESAGAARDLGERAPTSLPPETPVRALVEQVSSVEHAIVLGVPAGDGATNGDVRMTAGLGRPLVLTTLEPPEAMRILAGGSGRPRVAALALVAGAMLIVTGVAWAAVEALVPALIGSLVPVVIGALVPVALGASPSPGEVGGDPRSSGEGPGLVGEPGLALLAVAAIAIAAIVATSLYVRLTGGPSEGRSRR